MLLRLLHRVLPTRQLKDMSAIGNCVRIKNEIIIIL